MKSFSARTDDVGISVVYPDDWYIRSRCVPNLVMPVELFGLSSHPIPVPPKESDQPRPMTQALDARDILVWSYYQDPSFPDPLRPGEVPDYGSSSLPFEYRKSEVFPGYNAHEWSPSSFLWRRMGVEHRGVAVTIWVWEGTHAADSLLAAAEKIVASFNIEE